MTPRRFPKKTYMKRMLPNLVKRYNDVKEQLTFDELTELLGVLHTFRTGVYEEYTKKLPPETKSR